jgi:predicted dithiol-disulfide oxidoreductase (DUF899 family)
MRGAAGCQWVEIEKNYVCDGPGGKASQLDLFEGTRRLTIF